MLSVAPGVAHGVPAFDASMDPEWIHSTLRVLSLRLAASVASSLPVRTFDMKTQAEQAFRTLHSGVGGGKVVLQITTRLDVAGDASNHVVTGGTSGLGLLTARWLAQSGARSLILASRSGKAAKGVDVEWKQLHESHAFTRLEVCDTAEGARATACVEMHGTSAGRVACRRCVGRCTASDADGRVAPASVCTEGSWRLGAASGMLYMCDRGVRSVFFRCSLDGRSRQSNYGAANACLDTLTLCQRATGQSAVSVQWAGWAEMGMASRGMASKRMKAMEEASGFGFIRLTQGLAALDAAVGLHDGPAVLGVMPVVWSKLLRGGAVPAFLGAFAPKEAAPAIGVELEEDEPEEDDAVAGGVSLEQVLATVKRTSGGAINADAPLMESGVDSLGAVELRNQLQGVAGQSMTLPSTLIFDHPTARQLRCSCNPCQHVHGRKRGAQ